MTRPRPRPAGARAWLLAVAVALSALGGAAPAAAHPWHDDSPAGAPASAGPGAGVASAQSRGTDAVALPGAPRRGRSPAALATGAIVLLAALPRRRRTLALTVAALLVLATSAGALHAVLHLRHAAHPEGLAIGAPATQPAAGDLDSRGDHAPPSGPAREVWNCPATTAAVLAAAPAQGRAPPAPA